MLYYGALFNTTDYFGSIWKSDNDKYIIFGFFYLISIFYISIIGFLIIFYSFEQPEFGFRLAVGLTLYLNALGVLQHWINFAVHLKRKCDLRDIHLQKQRQKQSTVETVELQVNVQRRMHEDMEEEHGKKLEFQPHEMDTNCCYYICCCCIFCCVRDCCCHVKVCLGNYLCCFCRKGGCKYWCHAFCGGCACGGGCSSFGWIFKMVVIFKWDCYVCVDVCDDYVGIMGAFNIEFASGEDASGGLVLVIQR